jgi:hypothetical protein
VKNKGFCFLIKPFFLKVKHTFRVNEHGAYHEGLVFNLGCLINDSPLVRVLALVVVLVLLLKKKNVLNFYE